MKITFQREGMRNVFIKNAAQQKHRLFELKINWFNNDKVIGQFRLCAYTFVHIQDQRFFCLSEFLEFVISKTEVLDLSGDSFEGLLLRLWSIFLAPQQGKDHERYLQNPLCPIKLKLRILLSCCLYLYL